MKRYFGLFIAIVSAVAFAALVAQQPQTQTAPLSAINAKYVNGVAPGYRPTPGSGLTLNLSAGTANCSGTIVNYSGGTLTMTASTTNYVYLNTGSSCVPAVKTASFSASDIPIAVVTASGSAITVSDVRTPFQAPASGGSVPLYLNWTFNSGAAATDAAPRYLASHSGTISTCYLLTTASDSGTALTLNIFDNGTTIFSSGAQTVSAGTAAGTLTTLGSLSTTSISNNDKLSINIISGTSNWIFSVQCK